jgi:hypothetical protein
MNSENEYVNQNEVLNEIESWFLNKNHTKYQKQGKIPELIILKPQMYILKTLDIFVFLSMLFIIICLMEKSVVPVLYLIE